MTLINKEKFLNGVGKAVDGANSAADHVDKFMKDNGINKKINSAVNKTEGFIKEKEIDKKFNQCVDKTENFIKDNEIDKKAKSAVNSIGSGIKTAGEKMESAFKNNSSN